MDRRCLLAGLAGLGAGLVLLGLLLGAAHAAPLASNRRPGLVENVPPRTNPAAAGLTRPADCPVTYTVITGTGVLTPATQDLGNHCDDCLTGVTFPFPITLYGRTYLTGTASSNGNLQFTGATVALNTACLPSASFQAAALLVQDDLRTDQFGGGIYSVTLGTAPTRAFVLEWRATYYERPGGADAELVFYENRPQITMVYGSGSYEAAPLVSGVQSSAQGPATQYSCGPAGLANTLRVDYIARSACGTPTITATAPPSTPPPTTSPPPIPSPPSMTPCPLPFTDVHPADYFYGPVHTLYCRGVLSGYADHTFHPYADTTRAQLVKIVVLGFGIPIATPTAPTFSDVPASNPFYPFIETAVGHNLISGYGDGTFRPNANVTRGQLSKIAVIAARWPLLNPAAPRFGDVPPGSAFYPFVETAACHAIISGYGCGGPGEPCDPLQRPYFRPGANATRGQIAKIAYLSITGGSGCVPPPPVVYQVNLAYLSIVCEARVEAKVMGNDAPAPGVLMEANWTLFDTNGHTFTPTTAALTDASGVAASSTFIENLAGGWVDLVFTTPDQQTLTARSSVACGGAKQAPPGPGR